MKRTEASEFYRMALQYVSENHLAELEWVRSISPTTFQEMDETTFLWDYCWVVYASGFRVSTVQMKFPSLAEAFLDFDPDKLKMSKTAARDALCIINHRGKAYGFLSGVRRIHGEGFSCFKQRAMRKPEAVLRELPYIGPVTWKHLARNVGLMDISKDDVHLTRLMTAFDAPSVKALTSHLAEVFNEREGVVDLVLWRYCAEHGSTPSVLSSCAVSSAFSQNWTHC